MDIVYDRNSDTLQTRTRRYQRDREDPSLVRVLVPRWERIDIYSALPDWYVDAFAHERASLDEQ